MKHSLTLSVQVNSILTIIAIASSGIIVYQLIALFLMFRKRKKAREYTRFVRSHYTKNRKPTPALILRIQNDYIKDYNKAQNSLTGKLFRMKKEPLYGSIRDCSPATDSAETAAGPDSP